MGNKYLRFCLFFVVVEQAALAGSMVFLANAGSSLAIGDIQKGLNSLTGFFLIALIAYAFSACAEVATVKLKNSSWGSYARDLFSEIAHDQSVNSYQNKQGTVTWVIGESADTLSEISHFIVGTVSLYLNVAMMLIVFYLALGGAVTILMAASLGLSVLVVTIIRRYIEDLAAQAQAARLDTNRHFINVWDCLFHAGSKSDIGGKSMGELDRRFGLYFNRAEKYALIEQVVATMPVVVSVIALLLFLRRSDPSLEVAGAMIALLPRTLQFFGSIHALSICNSRALYLRSKYKSLLGFGKTLVRRHLNASIDFGRISVNFLSAGKSLTFSELLNFLLETKRPKGRVLITGSNGAGKSSLLQLLHEFRDDSIYSTPTTFFFSEHAEGSSGQNQRRKLDYLLGLKATVLLLDEWDSNFDDESMREYDQKLKEASQSMLVIEVRHRAALPVSMEELVSVTSPQ